MSASPFKQWATLSIIKGKTPARLTTCPSSPFFTWVPAFLVNTAADKLENKISVGDQAKFINHITLADGIALIQIFVLLSLALL